MEYIGIDPAVGLECSHCDHVTRVKYSALLHRVLEGEQVACGHCDRQMLHDWTTVSVVQNIIKRRMREAHEARHGRQLETG
ncbi:MAG: hypothetical protein ACNA7W_17520 [Pseudomonadales bacterium]